MNLFFTFLIFSLTCFASASGAIAATKQNVSFVSAENGLVPDRDVRYEDTATVPQWKVTWDRARQLSRQEKFAEALVQYELLFLEKENIAAARWEYVSILLHLKHWHEATASLDILLELEPDRREYLLARASILYETGAVDQAGALYGKLYESRPESPDAVIALEGLIASLEKQGKNDVLLPLLDQLMIRKPGDVLLQKKTAIHALTAGRPEYALHLLQKARQLMPDDLEILRYMAFSFEKTQAAEQAVSCWEQIAGQLPHDREAHGHLVDHYRKAGNNEKEYFHLEQALKTEPDDPEMLARIIDLSLQFGRADMALHYLAWFLSLRPDDTWGLTAKLQAERDLAQDLLVLIENNGSRQLWRDLVTVTVDRKGIYRAMADILRQENKERSLADVLLVLYEEGFENEEERMELQTLLGKQGRFDELTRMEGAGTEKGFAPDSY